MATDLVPGDTNDEEDVFVRDLVAGRTTRVSVSSAGRQADKYSWTPSISGNGRYVAFASIATNLVAGDTNGQGDVFVRDRRSGITKRVDVPEAGGQSNTFSFSPVISAGGTAVALLSTSTNLVAGDTNGQPDVFVRSLTSNRTSRVSVSSSGVQAEDQSHSPSISADGRYVAFETNASTLVPGDTNGMGDVFVRDRRSGSTGRVSVSTGGRQGDANSFDPSISADGHEVAFESSATDLVQADTNGASDIFLRLWGSGS